MTMLQSGLGLIPKRPATDKSVCTFPLVFLDSSNKKVKTTENELSSYLYSI